MGNFSLGYDMLDIVRAIYHISIVAIVIHR